MYLNRHVFVMRIINLENWALMHTDKKEKKTKGKTMLSCKSPTDLKRLLLIHSSRQEGVSTKFSSYFSKKTYVVGNHYECLAKELLTSTQKICFHGEMRICCGYSIEASKNISTFGLERASYLKVRLIPTIDCWNNIHLFGSIPEARRQAVILKIFSLKRRTGDYNSFKLTLIIKTALFRQ